jgi:hypothetical protein
MLTEITPIEHFKGLVTEAIQNQHVTTDPTTEFYLSRLLADFVDSSKLTTEPLAITYVKALEADYELAAQLLKELGDISLFTSGFFSDSLARKVMDVDYYITMGAISYDRLASIHNGTDEKNVLGTLFSELALKFKLFVEVLSEVSERCQLTSNTDILRIYERWLKTKSLRTKGLLRELGIEPQNISTDLLH